MEQILKKVAELGNKYKTVSKDLTGELRTLYKMCSGEDKRIGEAQKEIERLDKAYHNLHDAFEKANQMIFEEVQKGGVIDLTK